MCQLVLAWNTKAECIYLHVRRVHNIPFLGWKGRYNCMVLCIFIKIVASV